MKQTTAMQQLIAYSKNILAHSTINAHLIIEKAESLLELERRQIIDAVNSQRQLGWDEKGEDYYTEKFTNQNK